MGNSKDLRYSIPRLQYIVNPDSVAFLQSVLPIVLRTGVKGVQLRMKNMEPQKMFDIGVEAKKLCSAYKAILILNDHVHLARQINADGVHLGKSDMNPVEARKILGDTKIIGGTANNPEDIRNIYKAVNYIGLGPYRNTTTKENISPILGRNGIENIVLLCKKENIFTPIFAIGGIKPNDIKLLQDIGIINFAVSSAIDKSDDISETAKEFLKSINNRKNIEQAIYKQ